TMSGNGDKILDGTRTLTSASTTATWSGTGNLRLALGTTINNSGTFIILTDQSVIPYVYDFSPPGTINNSGTWIKTSPTGIGTTYLGAIFNNTGLVDLQSGLLQFDKGGYSTGTFNVATCYML